jgi:hypothetical protein
MARHRVVFGCVSDGKLRYQRQAVVLLASLRALGGEYADADFIWCVAGEIAPELRPYVARLGARVVAIDPVSGKLPATNKLRFLQQPELSAFDYVVLMDCDTAVAAAPSLLFGGAGVRARMAGSTSVPPSVLADLFARAGLPPQPERYWTTVKPERTPLYANSGVVVVATAIAEQFVACWMRYQSWLLDHPELLPGSVRHTNQASLALALVDSGVEFEPLDIEFNFPVHRAPPEFYTPAVSALAPVILHYDLTDDDGCLLPSPALGASAAIARVNNAWQHAR